MTVKASRALKAALAIGAVAVLSLSLVAMSACSGETEVQGEGGDNVMSDLEKVQTETVSDDLEEFSGTLDTVGYLNTKLKSQESWHSEKTTVSSAMLNTVVYTNTFKDYKDGVLVAEELVYSNSLFARGNTQSHQFMFLADTDDERSVYVRSGSNPANEEAGPDDITWNEDAEYWSEAYYNVNFGLFMDEISLYIINDNTLLYTYEDSGDVDENGEPVMVETDNGCGDIIKNEDGTYSQTFQLDTVNSVYYYSYSTMTHGGLSSAPTYTSVDVTFTFDEDWQVLSMVENDSSSGTTGSDCVTTTTFSYDEEDFDETTYAAGIAFFEPLEGTLVMQRTEEEILAAEQGDEAGDDVETEEDENEGLSSQDVEYTQYEKNLTLTVVMAIVVGVVIVLGIILTGIGCSAGGKKKNAQQGEDDEKKN